MASRPPSRWTRRILARLEAAEWREPNAHLRDDYRIAWLTVLYADRGVARPDVVACTSILGIAPEKVAPAIAARRKFILGPLYDEFWGVALPPRKPPQSAKVDHRLEKRVA
jgi:hypothetical protein